MSTALQEHPQPEHIHPKYYYVKFTGNYAQLKDLGYTFQKLHAANYQQWNKDDVRVWRKGQDVTHDELGNRFAPVLHVLLDMGIENLPFEQATHFPDTYWMRLYIHKETYECTADPSKYNDGRKRFWESWDKRKEEEAQGIEPTNKLEVEDWVELVFTPESVEPLRELAARNWIKLERRSV